MNPISSRTTELPRDLPQASNDQERSLLVFHLGAQAYAIPIEDVVQIIPMLKLTPIPQLDRMIDGVANIHGKFVPVIRARSRLGMDPIPLDLYTPIILVMAGDRQVGLIVDEVADVVRLPAGKITSPDAIMPEDIDRATILNGIVYQGDEAILVLDTRYLVRPSQDRAVNQMMQALPERPRLTEAELFSQLVRMPPPPPVAPPSSVAPSSLPVTPPLPVTPTLPMTPLPVTPPPLPVAPPTQASLPANNGGEAVVPAHAAPVISSPAAESEQAAKPEPKPGKKRSSGKAKQAQPSHTDAENSDSNGNGSSNGLRKSFNKAISAQIAELAADLPPVEGAPSNGEPLNGIPSNGEPFNGAPSNGKARLADQEPGNGVSASDTPASDTGVSASDTDADASEGSH